MPNMFEYLRMRNLFGDPNDPNTFGMDMPSQGGIGGNIDFSNPQPQSQPDIMGGADFRPTNPFDVNPAGQQTGGTDPYNVQSRMDQLYTPEHTALDKFNELLSNYPNRENYKPSLLRKIGASIMAVGGGAPRAYQTGGYMPPLGYDKAQEFLDKPFLDKLQDWKNQIGPSMQGAQLERQTNINERQTAMQTIADELRAQADEHKKMNDERNAQIKQQRADVYEYKAKNPDMKLVMTKGGNVMAMDPRDGSLHDTGIPTGSLSDADKLALTYESQSALQTQKGTQASDLEKQREADREKLAGVKGEQARKTQAEKPGVTGINKPETPTQTRVRQFNAARELYNTRPELRPFIRLGSPGSNDFTITPPGKGFFGGPTGPNANQYKEMQDKIYGGTTMTPTPAHGGTTTAPKAPAGWKYVPKPGGGWTAVQDPTNKGGG